MEPAGRSRSAVLVDALLAVAVAGVLVFVIGADQAASRSADFVAYAWALGLGALMFARRRYPRTVLAVTVLGVIAYFAAGYPAIPVSVPVAAALFSAAEAGRTRFAIGGALVLLAVSVAARLAEGDDAAFVVGYELVSHVALMGAAIALGEVVRLRRDGEARTRQIEALRRTESELRAQGRVRAERMAIARELHDSIGHALTVVSIHSHVASEQIGVDDDAARVAVRNIGAAATRTLRELRSTIGILRAGDRDEEPERPSIARLDPLVEAARSAGFDVDVRVDVHGLPIGDETDAAAYRIVQESVTNAIRHSAGSRVTIDIARTDDGELGVDIADDGGTEARPDAGHGLAGMAERAEAAGGSLRVTSDRGGFRVTARLPLEGS